MIIETSINAYILKSKIFQKACIGINNLNFAYAAKNITITIKKNLSLLPTFRSRYPFTVLHFPLPYNRHHLPQGHPPHVY